MKTKIITATVSILLIFVILKTIKSNAKDFREFEMTEEVKGCWVMIENYYEEHKKYPENIEELANYYSKTVNDLPFNYSKPLNKEKDEVIITWKEVTKSGKTIMVYESGVVEKKKLNKRTNGST